MVKTKTKRKRKRPHTRPPLKVFVWLVCLMLVLKDGEDLRILLRLNFVGGGWSDACYEITINEAGQIIKKPCRDHNRYDEITVSCRAEHPEDIKVLRTLAKDFAQTPLGNLLPLAIDGPGLYGQFYGYGPKQLSSDELDTISKIVRENTCF